MVRAKWYILRTGKRCVGIFHYIFLRRKAPSGVSSFYDMTNNAQTNQTYIQNIQYQKTVHVRGMMKPTSK